MLTDKQKMDLERAIIRPLTSSRIITGNSYEYKNQTLHSLRQDTGAPLKKLCAQTAYLRRALRRGEYGSRHFGERGYVRDARLHFRPRRESGQDRR